MTEVYKAMLILQCKWYKVNSYRVLCHWSALQPGETFPLPGMINGDQPLPQDEELPESNDAPQPSTADMMMIMDDIDDIEPSSKSHNNEHAAQQQQQALEAGGGAGHSGHGVESISGRGILHSHSPFVKAALSLYKVQQSIYLLDFQRVEVSFLFDSSFFPTTKCAMAGRCL